MSIGKWVAASCVALIMGSGVAVAAEAECTDALLEQRQKAFGAYLQENPDKAEKVGQAVATVEEKYGGEPPREKQCEALDELLVEIKKL